MSNPFEDPSVQAAQGQEVPSAGGGWGSAQPEWANSGKNFDGVEPSRNDETSNGGGFLGRFGRGGASRNAAAPAVAPPPPNSGYGGGSDDALRQREAQIAQREQELQRWQEDLRRQGGAGVRNDLVRNFPPCFPIVHHDINNEVPADKRWVVRRVLYALVFLCVMLTYQVLAVFFLMFHRTDLVEFFLSVIYWAFGVPGAWILWYMRLYVGSIRDSMLSFATFFVFFGIHIGFCIYCAIGPAVYLPNTPGSSGTAVTGFNSSRGIDLSWLKVMFYIGATGWTALAAYSVYCWLMVMNDFRGRNGPVRVQQEATRAALSAASKV